MPRRRERFFMSDAEARVQEALSAPTGDACTDPGAERLIEKIARARAKQGLAPLDLRKVERIVHVGGEARVFVDIRSGGKA